MHLDEPLDAVTFSVHQNSQPVLEIPNTLLMNYKLFPAKLIATLKAHPVTAAAAAAVSIWSILNAAKPMIMLTSMKFRHMHWTVSAEG